MNRPITMAAAVTTLCTLLSGCMSVSELSGNASYGCKAPDGVTCTSVSGTYANALQNNLPSQRRAARANATSPALPRVAEGLAAGAVGAIGAATSSAGPRVTQPASASTPPPALTPLRSSARILRLWFKPWEDADRDLYDQGYVYVQIDAGQWLIEHAHRQIRMRMRHCAHRRDPHPKHLMHATRHHRPGRPSPSHCQACPSQYRARHSRLKHRPPID